MSSDQPELDQRDVRCCESCGQELPDTASLEVEWLHRQQARIKNGLATVRRNYAGYGGTPPDRLTAKRERSIARKEFELDLVVRLTERLERLDATEKAG